MAGTFEAFSKSKVFRKTVLIFLTVGSWYKGFNRLVKAVDELVGYGIITDKVIAQIGNSSYEPKHMEVIDFCSPDEFGNIISQAKVVISHAGVGTIAQTIRKRKPIVVVPRKGSLGEHFDDHQFVTAETLEKEGKVLVAYETNDIQYKLEQAETFVPNQAEGSQGILNAIQAFIDDIIINKTD
jgi:beta-1,4-N-acetylglucosaminyltransferase